MDKNKQIEDLSFLLNGCRINGLTHYCETYNCSACRAEAVYNAGYRKQSDIINDVFKALIEYVENETPWGEISVKEIKNFQKEYMNNG